MITPSVTMGRGPMVVAAAIAAIILSQICSVSAAQQASCRSSLLVGVEPRHYDDCSLLPAQGASLAWIYRPKTNVLDVAFTGFLPKAGGWVAWGINSVPSRMVGTAALIGFSSSSGSTALPYKLTTALLQEKALVSSPIYLVTLETVSISGLEVVILASVQLKPNQSVVNTVWNSGPSVSDNVPAPHVIDTEHTTSFASIDFSLGSVNGTVTAGVPSDLRKKHTHALLCAVGFGLLLPLGVLSARYLRAFTLFEPYWFYIHAVFQGSGYISGVAGWALGLVLDSYTVYPKHKNLGIAIFTFASLQILTVPVRPAPGHKLRFYWNVVHHTLGYLVIFIAIANIFEGLSILAPGSGWRRGYVGFLVLAGIVVFAMEIITWIMYYMSISSEDETASASRKGDVESTKGEGSVHAKLFFRRCSDPSLDVSGAKAEPEKLKTSEEDKLREV